VKPHAAVIWSIRPNPGFSSELDESATVTECPLRRLVMHVDIAALSMTAEPSKGFIPNGDPTNHES
jgi:hypothetical protein